MDEGVGCGSRLADVLLSYGVTPRYSAPTTRIKINFGCDTSPRIPLFYSS